MKESTRREPGAKPPSRANNAKKEQAKSASNGKISEAMREKAERALASIVFVQLPPEAVASLGFPSLGGGIPLPVQTPGPIQRFDPSMVGAESVIAGILRVLAWQPDNKHAPAYRELVRALRPGLLAELSDAGMAKAQARDWEIAEEIFLALIGLYPDSPEPLLDLALLREEHAKLLREESNEDLAEEEDSLAFDCYKKLIALEPPFVPAFYHAAFFSIRTRAFDRAVSLFTTFISLSEDEKRKAKAREVLAKLKDMGYLDTTFKEAFDFIKMEENEKGIEKAEEFLSRYPGVWNGWFLLGWANRKLGRWDKGIEAFRKAIELGSSEPDTYNELALCQIETGDVTGARASLEKALAIEPENVKIIVNLGVLAHRTGKEREAVGFFNAALEIDPDDALARQWLDSIGGEA